MKYKVEVTSSDGEIVEVELHDKPIVNPSRGRYSPALSPSTYSEGEAYYYYDDLGEGEWSLYAQLFYVDAEYDGFIVEVAYMDDVDFVVRLHVSHTSPLEPVTIEHMNYAIDEIQEVLPQLDKFLENTMRES